MDKLQAFYKSRRWESFVKVLRLERAKPDGSIICEHCGNIAVKFTDAGVPLVCCGQKMSELRAGVTDASVEKHVPKVSVEGDVVYVEVGAVEHPMTDEHYIEWVCLETEASITKKALTPGSEPRVSFALNGERPTAVYAYCNQHGLWMTRI